MKLFTNIRRAFEVLTLPPRKSEVEKALDIAEKNAISVELKKEPEAPSVKISKIAQKVLDDLNIYPISEWGKILDKKDELTEISHSALLYSLTYKSYYYGFGYGEKRYSVQGLSLKEEDQNAITSEINAQNVKINEIKREKECAEVVGKMGFKLEDVKDELACI